ncbi:beta family protein [Saccharomonospora sp. NB11]|jgi:hypothetical protein|uniref:beta family protein n=1 Tax=Saccharomonospora sp. NB11 TaxID=1642298 RepID=UPI0018D1BA1B|nr:beta family protein [Saccharomonospora sp. NB11]
MPEARTPLLAVKSREGEAEALLQTSEATRIRVLVELLPHLTSSTRALRPLITFCTRAALSGNPAWVDVSRLPRTTALGASPRAVLEHFDDEIGGFLDVLPLVPVIPLTSSDEDLRALRLFLEHRERPVVIRAHRVADASTEVARRLEEIAQALALDVSRLHLVLDEEYVSDVDPHRVATLISLVTGLAERVDHASVTVLAGSTPAHRGTYRTHKRPRSELSLWKALRDACGEHVQYGDYGVVHPAFPGETKRGPARPNPYLHYTVPGESLFIARQIPERTPTSVPPGALQEYFLDVADELVDHPDFAGADFSWGDRRLYLCRTKRNVPMASTPKWIAAATSHHIAHLTKSGEVPARL